MTRWMKGTILIGVTVCVLAASSTPALAWTVQQRYHNGTGQTAYDLTKILKGYWNITAAIHDQFAAHSVYHYYYNGQWYTIIHWYDGTVAHCQSTWACFSTSNHKRPKVLCVLWTDQNGYFIGPASAVPAIGIGVDISGGSTIVTVGHDWANWTGDNYPPDSGDTEGTALGTITVSNVYYAVTNVERPMVDLDEALYTDPGITWVPLTGFSLDYGQTNAIDLGALNPQDVLLFRCAASAGGETSEEIIQVALPTIPTVSEWGLIILTLLLLTAGTIVFARRRRVVTA